MATLIRAKISEKNKYWIEKHRHYELKHFCLQYPSWKKAYSAFEDDSISMSMIENLPSSNVPSDPTAKRVMLKNYYYEKMKIIENAAIEADAYLSNYILKAVTENLSYTHLKARLNIPCSRDMYYDRYRRFFWLLSETRK